MSNEKLPTQKQETPEISNNHIYDNADILQILKISERTLAYWRSKGYIPFSKIGGKLFYYGNDILALLDRNKHHAFANTVKTTSHGKN